MIGQRLLHYEITEKLGEGGMGVVYKARDSHLDRFVAIKVLPPERVADPSRKARFTQEAKASSALNHPNIVTIYDISSDNGIDFITMEYVDGKTLDQIIPRNGLRLNEALKLAIQIADALARAHSSGIVHRDLKPANIMVDSHGQVKVLDFGLAKLTETSPDDLTRTMKTSEGQVLGTAAYMSPEQAEGRPVDARSDIFSFGSVLYEMVSGRRAFQGDSAISTLAAVLHHDPPELGAETPADLRKLIGRCLRKDPDKRFHHMVDLRVALAELHEEDSSTRQSGAPQAGARPKRKLAWWLGLAGTAIVLIGLSAAWWVQRHSRLPAAAPRLLPLTAYAGLVREPCFSPEGNDVVFSWNGNSQDNFDIYRLLIGAGSPLRLTTHKAMDYSPAWSPDGRWIAFLREGSQNASSLILIPALGGPERLVAEVSVIRSLWAWDRLAWSPNGKWLALRDGSSLSLISAEAGVRRVLTTPPAGQADFDPAFSRDGSSVAFVREITLSVCHLFVLRLKPDLNPAGDPAALVRGSWALTAPIWSPDGTRIDFGWGSWGNRRIWSVPADGSAEPSQVNLSAENISNPAISHRASRLVYARQTVDWNIWGLALNEKGSAAGRPQPLLASTQIEFEPRFSPDGNRIAFTSDRTGEPEIWVSDADGSNASPVTSIRGPNLGCPRWSPDGSHIAFDTRVPGHSDIQVVQLNGGRVRSLVTHPAQDRVPSWSGDGRWLYFASDRSGSDQIWKMPAEGGVAIQVTREGGFGPLESPDGGTLYYAKSSSRFRPTSLWRVPVDGGPEKQVLESMANWGTSCPVSGGVYFARNLDLGRGAIIEFLRFDTGKVEHVADLEKPLYLGLAVAPDRRRILFTQIDRNEANLVLVENFR